MIANNQLAQSYGALWDRKVSGSFPPYLKVARARGLGFQKGGSSVTNQPSVSDWVVQVPLWPSGLGVGLWNERPGFDPSTARYMLNTRFPGSFWIYDNTIKFSLNLIA